ncbi:TraR/DksA family transcriptional regulator [Humibacillus xanthopallidus]|uniref:TraR/DksA family transcriptional regulator n=1 Tax=Humibacillus xanthopallidus TaxID=412689 RepID=A0A543HJB4_9MICO|nr:TraR/DksA family transcriptional regulator [Humibacillus xanthopallidus]TQM58428.1 TraR/DksA family transcriptional regulator [Humibacillus xanthopallidus]
MTTSSTAAPRGASSTATKTTAKTAGTAAKTPTKRVASRLRVKDDESPWSEAEIAEVRQILIDEIEEHRAEVEVAERELDEVLRASGDGAGDDQADAGSKTAERAHEISVAANARAGLLQAEHALEQLEAGTYGICENCGNPIGKLRLQARPRATLCMPCQEKHARH